jgi:hypothetical protein
MKLALGLTEEDQEVTGIEWEDPMITHNKPGRGQIIF